MRLAAILVLCATSAAAGLERMSLIAGDGPCFAIVAVENRSGRYTAVESLGTSHGVVSIRYETVGGHNATDFDLVDVVDLPAGVAASPLHIDLPDGETGAICLMEWRGVRLRNMPDPAIAGVCNPNVSGMP